MPTKITHTFIVRGSQPLTVEVDTEAQAFYVRFKRAKVARTVPRETRGMHLAIDLDANDEVIGIESVGCGQMTIAKILQQASVQAPNINFAKSRIVATELVPA